MNIIRNLIAAMLGLALLVGLMTAGFFVAIALIGGGLVLWVILRLRAAKVLGNFRPDITPEESQPQIIEAEYEEVKEDEPISTENGKEKH